MSQIVKQKLIYLLKAFIGAALITWILLQIDRQKFLEYFTQLDITVVLLICSLSVISLSIQFKRWKYLLLRNSSDLNFKELLPSFFAGFSFRLMLPGGHAEISKIFLLSGKKRGKALAFGMEKFFQTFIKLFLILAVLPISFPQYTIYCFAVIVILIIIFIYTPRISLIKEIQEKQVNNYLLFANTTFFSLAIFVVMAIQYFILLNQIHTISILATLHTVIYLWGAGIIPISISGLGIREGLAVYFLKLYGITPAHAVATSLFLFTLNTISPALIGTYFIYKKKSYFDDLKNSIRSSRDLIKNLRNGRQIK